MSDDQMPTEAVRLMGQIMEANARHTHSITNDLIANFKAERDATRALLAAALESIPFGGTTAEYEAGIERCRRALYPSFALMDVYRARARQWLNGEPEDPEPVLWRGMEGMA